MNTREGKSKILMIRLQSHYRGSSDIDREIDVIVSKSDPFSRPLKAVGENDLASESAILNWYYEMLATGSLCT